MKRLLALCSMLFALSACSGNLYIKNLRMDITNAPYSPEEYILGQFDCSNMASLMDNYLEGKGYDSKIMVVQESNGPHAYVIIDNETIAEPVTKKILKGKTPQDYPGAVIFNDPEMLQAYFEPEKWEREWGYKPVNLEVEIGKGVVMAGAFCLIAYFFAGVIIEHET